MIIIHPFPRPVKLFYVFMIWNCFSPFSRVGFSSFERENASNKGGARAGALRHARKKCIPPLVPRSCIPISQIGTGTNSHSLIRSSPGSQKSTAGVAEDTFWGKAPSLIGGYVGTPRTSFVRTQTPSIKQTAPSVVIQSPSFPSGFPPPRGIGDSPRIMHDKRGCDTRAYRGALTKFKRRALPAEIPARGEEFGRAHFARVYLELRRRATLKERAATFKRRLRRL